jgi:hypothetical protein
MAGLDLMEIVLEGNGPRYEALNLNFDSFKALSDPSEQFIIYVGEGKPKNNVKIWITKTNTNNFKNLIDEMKLNFDTMNELELVGVDNFDSISLNPRMCILVSRDGIIRTFQNPDDLNLFIVDLINTNSLK